MLVDCVSSVKLDEPPARETKGRTSLERREAGMSRRADTARRTCIGCREVRPHHELVRLVVAPDGQVVVDLDRRLPGRGAHVCPRSLCVEQAIGKNALERAFRRSLPAIETEALVGSMCERLEKKLSALLGMGQRARHVISGSSALEEGLKRGEVHLLVLATDVSSDQRARWVARYQATGRPWVVHFTKEGLGAILGKGLRSVAGITNPKLAGAASRVASMMQALEEERKGVRMHGNDAHL
jgi:predicted RNA-binding protein YlxR (DUF448 family)